MLSGSAVLQEGEGGKGPSGGVVQAVVQLVRAGRLSLSSGGCGCGQAQDGPRGPGVLPVAAYSASALVMKSALHPSSRQQRLIKQ